MQNRARDYMEWLNRHVTIGSPVINRQCPRDRDYMERINKKKAVDLCMIVSNINQMQRDIVRHEDLDPHWMVVATIGSPVINRQCPRARDYME